MGPGTIVHLYARTVTPSLPRRCVHVSGPAESPCQCQLVPQCRLLAGPSHRDRDDGDSGPTLPVPVVTVFLGSHWTSGLGPVAAFGFEGRGSDVGFPSNLNST